LREAAALDIMTAMRLFRSGTGRRARAAVIVAVLALVASVVPGFTPFALAADPRHVDVDLSAIATGLIAPIGIAAPNDGASRLMVIEQAGRIRVYVPGSGLRSTAYLDIRSRVLDGGERGLLGLAFHPSFKSNGYFFVDYTDNNGNIQISRFTASPTSNTASSTSELKILTIGHPTYSNHNGGQLAFRGGYLYIGVGDGGGGGDPNGNAQKLTTLLGKILRIDIDHHCSGRNYCSPSTNPFASSSTAKHAIWDYGLRNPWRFSFNTATGGLRIGDVGQGDREELDAIARGAGGKNLGWDCREGTLNTVSLYGGSYCTGKTFTAPVYEYSHANGRCAVIGGFVYNGKAYASVMGGVYLYADYCTGEIWGLADSSSGWINHLVGRRAASITSFGQAVNGELYMVDAKGVLWRVKAHKV
jgi:glucose/arabinose dehydrogenase